MKSQISMFFGIPLILFGIMSALSVIVIHLGLFGVVPGALDEKISGRILLAYAAKLEPLLFLNWVSLSYLLLLLEFLFVVIPLGGLIIAGFLILNGRASLGAYVSIASLAILGIGFLGNGLIAFFNNKINQAFILPMLSFILMLGGSIWLAYCSKKF